ncbi:MAG: gas vesicle protein GvpJ [Tepidisphaeraceae bacterium]|jgi:hypothetical protein
MATQNSAMIHSTDSTNLADLLERVLDKGIVIAGDIRVKIVDIELLTIQIRLVVCSVDKARDMGMDWWVNHPVFAKGSSEPETLKGIEQRLERIEAAIGQKAA